MLLTCVATNDSVHQRPSARSVHVPGLLLLHRPPCHLVLKVNQGNFEVLQQTFKVPGHM